MLVTKTNTNVKTLIDLCVELYGDTSYAFKLINDNPFLTTIQDTIEVGDVITYDNEIVFLTKSVVNVNDIPTTPSLVKQKVVREFQSIYDMAVQLYGSIEGVFTLINDNSSLDNLNDSITGLNLTYTEQALSLTEYFKTNKINITTGNYSSRTFDDSFDLSFN